MRGPSQRTGKMPRYSIHLDVRYAPLERFDVPALARITKEPWFNQTLVRVNESVLRLGVVKGEFHWHRHRREDELFFVLRGRLFIDLRDRTITLGPGQGVTVPRMVMHRTRAPRRTVALMVATAGIKPTGD